jgi:hypothetical protein
MFGCDFWSEIIRMMKSEVVFDPDLVFLVKVDQILVVERFKLAIFGDNKVQINQF